MIGKVCWQNGQRPPNTDMTLRKCGVKVLRVREIMCKELNVSCKLSRLSFF